MDVKVSSLSIKDLNSGSCDPRNNVHSAHILCSIEDEKGIKKQMYSMYNKTCKQSCAAKDLPEGYSFRYVPLNQTNHIAPTACRKAQLIKAKICQK